jgi:glycine C-acetyltransferase
MAELEAQLKQANAEGARFKLIATDGVFSMDGVIANLKSICDLADKYDALVMVDDSHAVGFIGENGRGTHEYCGVLGRVDIITGTLGKALGGASGGYTSGRKRSIELAAPALPPYLFSNSLAPAIVAATSRPRHAGRRPTCAPSCAQQRRTSARDDRRRLHLWPGEPPIIPVMLGDAKLASEMAEPHAGRRHLRGRLLLPRRAQGQARIRTQMSAAHTREQLDKAIAAFIRIGRELGVITWLAD